MNDTNHQCYNLINIIQYHDWLLLFVFLLLYLYILRHTLTISTTSDMTLVAKSSAGSHLLQDSELSGHADCRLKNYS